MPVKFLSLLFFCLFAFPESNNGATPLPVPAAEYTAEYFPLLSGKRIGIFTNHTGTVGNEHLVDRLKREGFQIALIFSPEHGFRGHADAGEKVSDETDAKTGIPVYSLYKNNSGKPDDRAMSKIDILITDAPPDHPVVLYARRVDVQVIHAGGEDH